jgi:hypothetical protein
MDNDDYDAFLNGVEMHNGVPIILSRYGYKKIEMEGKKYLLAMSETELAQEIALAKSISLDSALEHVRKEPYCYSNGMWGSCNTAYGCKKCHKAGSSAGWWCECVG